MNVLIAEDDENIRNGLAELLNNEGYSTVLARNGAEALELFRKAAPDFVCLDIMMPGANGYDVCREIRKKNANVPVIFISAKSEEVDKVLGLELGADDYILKPFGVREVLARIRAVTRRCLAARQPIAETPSFVMDDLEIFPAELRAHRGDITIDLSLREVRILQLLHARKGQVVDRDTFFNECWGLDYLPNSRTLDQHIAKLRKRIERDPKLPRLIHTVHGVGYRFDG
ncbi:MAG: response regulator transcription factor [Candidatus Hydrogenedentes bacterium]|nr:response regulator transcription factor [Candidatus Hydrogenedentota bacterium]